MVSVTTLQSFMLFAKSAQWFHDWPQGNAALLQHVYQHHKPKDERWKLGEIPKRDSDEYSSEMKSMFRNAVVHYHPDRAKPDVNGKKWKVLCEEITKVFSNRYESFKG